MAEPTKAASAATKQKTYTNWKAFAQASLVPTQVTCEGYKPVFMADISCHSKLLIKGSSIKNHYEADHGGGFTIKVAVGQGKGLEFWKELEDLGMEAHDFRCDICDKQLRFHPSSILPHMKAHGGKTRRVYPGGSFNFTIAAGQPEVAIQDEDESNN